MFFGNVPMSLRHVYFERKFVVSMLFGFPMYIVTVEPKSIFERNDTEQQTTEDIGMKNEMLLQQLTRGMRCFAGA